MAQLTDEEFKILLEQTEALISNHPEDAPVFTRVSDREAVYDIYGEGPIITSAKQISEPATLDKFQRLLKELVLSDYEEEAFHYTLLLEEVLYKQYISLKTENPDLFKQYEELLNIARYVCITTLNLDEIESLIRGYSLAALKYGVNIKRKIDDALIHYDDYIKDGEVAEKFYHALGNSIEILGNQPLPDLQDVQKITPTIKAWILNYLSFPLAVREERRSSFQRINYFEKSPQVRNLSEKDKQYLRKIIEIYDWLAFGNESSTEEENNDKYIDADLRSYSESFGSESVENVDFKKSNFSSQNGMANKAQLTPPNTSVALKQNYAPEPVKKIDLNEILNTGRGVRMNASQEENSENQTPQPATRIAPPKAATELKPVQAVQKVQSDISKNEQHAKELLDKIKIVKKAPEVPVKIPNTKLQISNQEQEEDLRQIRSDIEKKKAVAQSQIDKKIQILKEKVKNESSAS